MDPLMSLEAFLELADDERPWIPLIPVKLDVSAHSCLADKCIVKSHMWPTDPPKLEGFPFHHSTSNDV